MNQNQNKIKVAQPTYYEELMKEDHTRFFVQNLDDGKCGFDNEGNFVGKQIFSKNTPWIFNKALSVNPEFIMDFCTENTDYCANSMGFIHSRCQECWKVVVKLQTVKQLFEMRILQETVFRDIPCKCGIENRPSVPRLYGAYFYNRSIEEGRECWSKVKDIVRESISPAVEVILKRGCTEFELTYGPSDKWKIAPGQLKFEKMLKEKFTEEKIVPCEQPSHLTAYLKRKWLHWASDHYDPTLPEFTGGKWLPRGEFRWECIKQYLYPHGKAVTYHKKGDNNE